jgi:hypothetical protein
MMSDNAIFHINITDNYHHNHNHHQEFRYEQYTFYRFSNH